MAKKLKIKGIINPLERSVKFIQSFNDCAEEKTIYFESLDEWNSINLLDGRVADIHFHSYDPEINSVWVALYEVINGEIDYNKVIKVNLSLKKITCQSWHDKKNIKK